MCVCLVFHDTGKFQIYLFVARFQPIFVKNAGIEINL